MNEKIKLTFFLTSCLILGLLITGTFSWYKYNQTSQEILGKASTTVVPEGIVYYDAFKSIKPDSYKLIDVRSAEEYSSKSIPNSINIFWKAPDIREKLNSLEKENNYIIYSTNLRESKEFFRESDNFGFRNISILKLTPEEFDILAK